MGFPKDTEKEIKDLFKDDQELVDRLLAVDTSVISTLASNNYISAYDVKKAFESGKKKDLDALYKEAVYKVRRNNLYFKLLSEYTTAQADEEAKPKSKVKQKKSKK